VGDKFSPWFIQSVDVPGLNVSGNGDIAARVMRTGTDGATGPYPPGGYPWRDPALRLAAANVAKNQTSPTHSTVSDAATFYTSSDLPGIGSRIKSYTALTGVASQTIADRVLIGTYYDEWVWSMWLGMWEAGVDRLMMRNLHQFPGSSRSFLSFAEWNTLWAGPEPPGGSWLWRQVDILGSSIEFHVTFTYEPGLGSPTSPVLTRKLRTPERVAQDWWQSDIIEGLPTLGTLSDTASTTVVIGGAWGTTPTTVPRRISDNVPITTPVDEFSMINVQAGWIPTGAPAPQPGETQGVYREFINYSPQWPTGLTPGFDETGGIPPADPPSTVYRGGASQDRYAYVRMEMFTRINLRMRWYGYTFGTPPLWQRQRIGVIDAPESFASGLLTPQSSPWQGGML
jgi:hypothetical protein